MKDKVFNAYSQLPAWAKGATAVVVLGGIAFVGYRIYRGLKQKSDDKQAEQTMNEIDNDIKKMTAQGMRPSYSASQYRIWADAAESCYQGWGTCSGDTIFVNLKNDLDVLLLIQAFGIRTIKSGAFNPTPDYRGDLPSVVRDELNGSQIAALNKILAKNNIKYRF
jgi:hypothetical protein